MSSNVEKICVEALSLPRKSRAEIAHRLLQSLEQEAPSPQVEADWKAIAHKRLEGLGTGHTTVRPARPAMPAARRKLSRQ
ncbi:MAG: addiction module protein [Verrucomicrobiae bacterium]|nr:addiction module protein [Verrucomicrobiae bacterium]